MLRAKGKLGYVDELTSVVCREREIKSKVYVGVIKVSFVRKVFVRGEGCVSNEFRMFHF